MPPSPLTTTLIQSTILNAISNLLAQVIDQYRKDKPFSPNIPALIQFVTYGIIIVPINVAWQRWLELTYPGFLFTSQSATTAAATATTGASLSLPSTSTIPISIIKDDTSETQTDGVIEVKEKLIQTSTSTPSGPLRKRKRIYNFVMKFFLDQTIGGILNIILFVALINLLKGTAWGRVYELVCEDFSPIFIARLKYRPIVSTLLYTVVPLDRRVVFGSACGVIWGVYLSLYAAV